MVLKLYVDRMSQPCSSPLLINGIDFEEILVDISKNQQVSLEYKAINPMSQVPAITDGRFKLFESLAILIYLSYAFPGVASYCRIWISTVVNTILARANDLLSSAQVAKESEKILVRSFCKLENFWLKDGRFLVGNSQSSIADLNLVCEIMQLELLSKKDRNRILSPYKKVLQSIEDTKIATAPHFDEVHGILFKALKNIRENIATQSGNNELKSKL